MFTAHESAKIHTMQSHRNNLILRLDVSGAPLDWISRQQAASLYSRDQVRWEAGDQQMTMFGGYSRLTGKQSMLEINSIVATCGVRRQAGGVGDTPALTNRALFRRDSNTCMYCGDQFQLKNLTRDHVKPVSRGGLNTWENVVSACVSCNTRKGSHTLDEMRGKNFALIAIPYAPNRAEGLILANRNILADQMKFLLARIGKNSRLKKTA